MNVFLTSTIKRFNYYRGVGKKAMEQLDDKDLFYQCNPESNSIAIIVNHLHGNMLSRWTNFLEEDGEKDWRKRDAEFEDKIKSREELINRWNEGWDLVMNTLRSLTIEDINRVVKIRGEPHPVVDAINRQMTHYAYHVGQIVFIAKMIKGKEWKTLTIAKGKSEEFNQRMMRNR